MQRTPPTSSPRCARRRPQDPLDLAVRARRHAPAPPRSTLGAGDPRGARLLTRRWRDRRIAAIRRRFRATMSGMTTDGERRPARRPRPRAAQRGPVGLPARARARTRCSASGSASPSPRCASASPRSRTPACCASSRRSSTPGRSATARRSSPPRSTPTASTRPPRSISAHPGVSHNYKRNHAYNLWYTIAVPPGDVARRPRRRAAPRVGRARHPQAPHAEALQDRREARHDRQDRGRRQGRGARARAPGAHEPTWRRPSSPTSRSRRSASCRRTSRSSSARSPRTAS